MQILLLPTRFLGDISVHRPLQSVSPFTLIFLHVGIQPGKYVDVPSRVLKWVKLLFVIQSDRQRSEETPLAQFNTLGAPKHAIILMDYDLNELKFMIS